MYDLIPIDKKVVNDFIVIENGETPSLYSGQYTYNTFMFWIVQNKYIIQKYTYK